MKISLAVCITFYYKHSRIRYLKKTICSLASISWPVDIFVISNIPFSRDFGIDNCCDLERVNIRWIFAQVQGHPLLLTWAHFDIWKKLDLSHYTHFLYLEDDISFGASNLNYWCQWREILRPHRLIPGFVRFESSDSGSHLYATDICSVQFMPWLPSLRVGSNCRVFNLLYPYQGMYLFDRELILEFLSSPAFSPNYGIWKIQEKAAQGLTFYDIPKGFYSRIVVPVDVERRLILNDALVEHSCATYASNSASRLAKIPIDQVISRFPTFRFIMRTFAVRVLDAYLLRHRN